MSTFAVTAAHVVQEFFNNSKFTDVHCSIASHGKRPLRISLGDRLIDASAEIDIATFAILPDEIEYLLAVLNPGGFVEAQDIRQ